MKNAIKWAVCKPNEGYVVTTIENANMSRLCSTHTTKASASAAMKRYILRDIAYHWSELARLLGDQ